MIPAVDRRLSEWGDYMRVRRDFGIGYPQRNIIHRCMVEGPGAGQSTARGDEPMPEHIAEVEEVVCAMTEPLRMVLREKYIRLEIDRIGAKHLHISVPKYRRRVEQAHYYIAGCLRLEAA